MPDPADPTPVKVVPKGDGFAVVDKDGNVVKDGMFSSREAAESSAATVNAAWARAKRDRKAAGSPEISESARQKLRDKAHGFHGKFKPGDKVAVRGGFTGTVTKSHGEHTHVKYDDDGKERRVHNKLLRPRWPGEKPIRVVEAIIEEVLFNPAQHPRARGGKWARTFTIHLHGRDEKVTGDSIGGGLAVVHRMNGISGRPEHQVYHMETGMGVGAIGDNGEDPGLVRDAMAIHFGGKDYTGKSVEELRSDADLGGKARSIAKVRGAFGGTREVERGQKFRKDVDMDRVRRLRRQEDEDRRLRPVYVEEGLVTALHSLPAGHMRARFNPALHPHDRHGKFAEVLGRLLANGHGSRVEFPSGVKVENRLGRLHVSSPFGHHAFQTPEAASSVAIAGHEQHEHDERGADLDAAFPHLMHELTEGRNAALRSGALGDASRVEGVMQKLRLARNKRLNSEVVPHRGRTDESLDAYRSMHTRPTPESMRAFANALHRGEHPHAAPYLPNPDASADQLRPRFEPEKMRVTTGYGVFTAREVPGAAGIFELHRDGKPAGHIGVRSAAVGLLGQLHDEAMQRHLAARVDQRRQTIEDILKA